MKRTALLLGTVLLGSLLAAPPALAAAAPATSVTRVKAAPADRTGECPTTVAFAATVAAKGQGTVRYRWVRGDGSKSAIRSFRVNGARKVVVRDRQTFDRDTSGWQAVEVLGRRGLSAKARFRVSCTGSPQRYDVVNPLPAQPDRPLVAAASVQASPSRHDGACPATVTFTATIQVSRTPAKVGYQWIDSATGEGAVESMYFAGGGPRSRQVTLPLAVGTSTAGWRAVRILNAGGHDSGRASYDVTCRVTPGPEPTRTPTPKPTLTPTPTPTTSSTPRPTTTSEPPAQQPQAAITALTPGDYQGYCDEPVAYQATGRLTLPAGPAASVGYWWSLDGAEWQHQTVSFPAAGQTRTQDVTAAWSLDQSKTGTHKLALTTRPASAQAAERTFALSCTTDPDPAKLAIPYMLTPVYRGDCGTGSIGLRADARITTDRDAEVRYRIVVDGKPGPVRTQDAKPGRAQSIGDLFYISPKESGGGVIRIEVLNHNKLVKEKPYTVTCVPQDPSPGAVRISEFWPVHYFGDCAEAPYVTAHGAFRAAPDTEITWRWVMDGKPTEAVTYKTNSGGLLQVQAAYWNRDTKTSGVVRLEVLNHNKPSIEGTYPVTCE
ncbi:hypothetical protein ACIA8R_24490 [Nonomuraea sp. NPDC051191]|uniref:hypothetical protein n=1 Tax=Nonomuraea sp. NPDC051191 TaxID=3364372 RepID=UPI0037A25F93